MRSIQASQAALGVADVAEDVRSRITAAELVARDAVARLPKDVASVIDPEPDVERVGDSDVPRQRPVHKPRALPAPTLDLLDDLTVDRDTTYRKE